MTNNEIIAIQRRIGTVPDGFWGPKSIAACRKHLLSMMPQPSPWPRQTQAALRAFYGHPGDERNLVHLPVSGLGLQYGGKAVRHVRCHRHVAESLLAVLADISAGPNAYVLRYYAGCYNNRNVRGGSVKSLHAWGAAIDLWPERNGNWTHWPTRAAMPLEVMEAFAREGWVAAGAFWGRDACHFQATSPA